MKSVKEQILNSLGWFLAKLKTTFTQKSDIINNCVSTATDAPLSAAQGKALSDSISALNSSVSQQINELNSNLDQNAINNPQTNVLLVDLNGNDIEPMKPSMIATEDASSLAGSPIASGAFYAFRKVYYLGSKVVVELHEAYPNPGRIWTASFDKNQGSWSAWDSSKVIDWNAINNKPTIFPQNNIWSGQLAYDSNMSFPTNIVSVKYPDGTIDIHINMKCEINKYQQDDSGLTNTYNIWSMATLKSICQVSSIDFNSRQTYATVLDPYGSLIDEVYWGRCGLLLSRIGNTGLALSRQYDDELSITGAWEASSKIYTPGYIYHMDIYRAFYT